MKYNVITIFYFMINLQNGFAEDKNQEFLKDMKHKMETVLSNNSIVDPKIIVENDRLDMYYKTQKYTLHSISRIGEVSQETHEEIGPCHNGIMITIYVQKTGAENKAVLPQVLRRPYWETSLFLATNQSMGLQGYICLSYGTKVEKSLLKKIQSSLCLEKNQTILPNK